MSRVSGSQEERVAELEQALAAKDSELAKRSDHPPMCPITGRKFFMSMEHPERGTVATYGGPFDSYTIPEPDEDGCFRSERYDHDRGLWVEGGEPERFHILTDTEHNELWETAQRAEAAEAALEAARLDTERLDWLEANIWNGDMLLFPGSTRHGVGITHRDCGSWRFEDFGDNVRAAIDAARESGKEPA